MPLQLDGLLILLVLRGTRAQVHFPPLLQLQLVPLKSGLGRFDQQLLLLLLAPLTRLSLLLLLSPISFSLF